MTDRVGLRGRKPTAKALRECAYALKYFLDIGWRKSDLDMLETLWWRVRDDNGDVKLTAEKGAIEE